MINDVLEILNFLFKKESKLKKLKFYFKILNFKI